LKTDAPFRQLRAFAEVTAHEIAHQWFGDLVTPAWWTDIWLNESFAEWLGKKIGDQWRPDLGIATSGIEDAFAGMEADALGGGRPIRQQITENRQIASAFDSITYEKGGQVLSMFETFLGAGQFAKGVNLHLQRYRHGNATAEDFFRSLAEAAGNSGVVDALRTFTDQTGVPLLTVTENARDIALSQARYRPLGVAPPAKAQIWQIPVCLARGASPVCSLLQGASATIPAFAGKKALMPNAGGAGYYRFRLNDAGWDRLIAEAGVLPGREALAFADSLWADFAAGTGTFQRVIAAARGLSVNPERLAALELSFRLADLAKTTLTADQQPQYLAADALHLLAKTGGAGVRPEGGGALAGVFVFAGDAPVAGATGGNRGPGPEIARTAGICGCRLPRRRHAGARSGFSRHGAEGHRAGTRRAFHEAPPGSHAEINGLAVPF
jgi:hypothetical protein